MLLRPSILRVATTIAIVSSVAACGSPNSEAPQKLTSDELRDQLARSVREVNLQLAASSGQGGQNPCGDGQESSFCVELTRVELREDLGINRYARFHNPRVDLDSNVEARGATAYFLEGFVQEHEELCQGESLNLMQTYGFKVGIVYETPGGIEIVRGVVNAQTCSDWAAMEEAISAGEDTGD